MTGRLAHATFRVRGPFQGPVLFLFCIGCLLLAIPAAAQEAEPEDSVPPPPTSQQPPAIPAPHTHSTVLGFSCPGHCWLGHLARDQFRLWSWPGRLGKEEARELATVGALGAGLWLADPELSRHSTTQFRGRLTRASEGIGRLGSWGGGLGIGGGLLLTGLARGDRWQQQTGELALEALFHTAVVTTAVKGLSGRERPYLNDARGDFGRVGRLQRDYFSFPSGHSATAWSLAAVIAERYPERWVKVLSYSLASAVSVSRITGKNHFYSDVLIGGYVGYKIGKWVVRSHGAEGPRR